MMRRLPTLALLCLTPCTDTALSQAPVSEGRTLPIRQAWGAVSVAFASDGKTLATGGDRIRIWETATGRELRSFGVPNAYSVLVLSPTRHWVAEGAPFNTEARDVRLWDAENGKEIRRLDGQPARLLALAFAPDGKSLATMGREGVVALWDVETGKQLHRFLDLTGFYGALAFSPDGKLLAAGGEGGHVRVWRVGGWNEAVSLEEQGPMSSVAFSADGGTIVIGDGSGRIGLWDVKSGKLQRRFKAHHAGANAITFAPGSSRLLVSTGRDIGSSDGDFVRYLTTVRAWDLVSGKERQLDHWDGGGHDCSVAFSPNGQVVAWSRGPEVYLRDATNLLD